MDINNQVIENSQNIEIIKSELKNILETIQNKYPTQKIPDISIETKSVYDPNCTNETQLQIGKSLLKSLNRSLNTPDISNKQKCINTCQKDDCYGTWTNKIPSGEKWINVDSNPSFNNFIDKFDTNKNQCCGDSSQSCNTCCPPDIDLCPEKNPNNGEINCYTIAQQLCGEKIMKEKSGCLNINNREDVNAIQLLGELTYNRLKQCGKGSKKKKKYKKKSKKNYKKIGGSLLSKDCKDYEQCCPLKYYGKDVEEPTPPLYGIGQNILVTCPSSSSEDETKKYGIIIPIQDALGKAVHDAECGRDKYGEIFTINDCECCIDRPESGSVWFLADMQRKYFVKYENDYIDLVFESYISNI